MANPRPRACESPVRNPHARLGPHTPPVMKNRRLFTEDRTIATRGQRGFTLIEIMVVVVIIGLLAALVAPTLIGNIDRAAVNRARADIRSIETALNLYRLDNFSYPTTDQGLQALVSNPGETAAPNWKAYLRSLPSDPWNQPYQYAYPGQRSEFDLFTYGADGVEGGDDINADIGNWDMN